MDEKFIEKMKNEQDRILEYGWVLAIVFFLVLFLSQALYVWILGSVGSFFVWIALVLWSLFATYFLLFGNSQSIFKKVQERFSAFTDREPTNEERIDISKVPEVERLVSKPADTHVEDLTPNLQLKHLEQEAHDRGALISHEGLRHILQFGNAAEKILYDVIAKARDTYPRFDGWTVLNKSQIESLLRHELKDDLPLTALSIEEEIEEEVNDTDVVTEMHAPPHEEVEEIREEKPISIIKERTTDTEGKIIQEKKETPKETPKVVARTVAPPINLPTGVSQKEVEKELSEITKKKEEEKPENIPAPVQLPKAHLKSPNADSVSTFLSLLCTGDEAGLFTFVRQMRQGREKEVQEFVTQTILMLDRVHEHRVDGVGYVDQHVLEETRCFSNEEIEEIIAILVRSVDYRYKVSEIGIKLALVRAVEYIKKHRKD